ncbi:diguanylate cyclase [Sedimentitalea sp. XS_ASV28]|uniref:diguanylate cyclase n=1 Tax=Sedimentitalea sp. XS_ASV28 TaxID=3241296 RepID=UPI00351853C0
MQGTILIVDGVSTNRIMLKVQLSAAYYHVVQSDGIDGLETLIRRTRPELIVTAMTLPDGTAHDVRALLDRDETMRNTPIIAIAAINDRAAQFAALKAGIDDVLLQPIDDLMLQARIRSLIRARSSSEELHWHDRSQPATLGFAEPAAAALAPPSNIALLTHRASTGAIWRARLREQTSHRLQCHRIDNIHDMMTGQPPEAIVVDLTDSESEPALRLLVDLRSRAFTSHAALIAIVPETARNLGAEALDRGAHDVLQSGFCAEELAIRIDTQLRHKKQSDRFRASVRDGLRAAIRDPMTGLFNRRYALPHLAAIAGEAATSGSSFAVMLADLDHFKRINDCFGHPAGDSVLIEAARRLQSQVRACDMVARVGGEEFMIVIPDADQHAATLAAERLCRQINSLPFHCPGIAQPINVTTSIGVVVGSPSSAMAKMQPEQHAELLISQADRALYGAKHAGRNQVSLIGVAA